MDPAPTAPQGADNWPSAATPAVPSLPYPPYNSDSYSGQGGLLGRLIALEREQSQYQPAAGPAAPSASPALPTQKLAQYEADQAQQSREAAMARLARGVKSLSRATASPPHPIDIAKSAGVGVANGAIGLIGTPFQVMDWAHQAVNAGIDAAFNAISGPPKPSSGPPNINAVRSEDIRRLIEEKVTGRFYQPQSTSGRYAETIGEMAPLIPGQGGWAIGGGAVRGGAGVASREMAARLVTDAVLPGIAVQGLEEAFPDSRVGQSLQKAWPLVRRELPYGPAALEAARPILAGLGSS